MTEGSSPAKTFVGVRFLLLGFDPFDERQVRSKLVDCGGEDVAHYSPNCTHVIVDKIVYDDPVCVAARNDAKTLVTALWVHHSFDVGLPIDPTWTMVGLMGAQFSKPLVANKVTHLVCYKFEGEKYEIAKKIPKMKLVNHRWLEDCCATGSSATWEELDDQIVLFIWSKRSRLPFSDIVKDLFESAGGFSLLATHTTISGKFLYHVPKYRKLPAEKRPNSKLAQEETKLFVPVIDCNGEMVSTAVESSKTRK